MTHTPEPNEFDRLKAQKDAMLAKEKAALVEKETAELRVLNQEMLEALKDAYEIIDAFNSGLNPEDVSRITRKLRWPDWSLIKKVEGQK